MLPVPTISELATFTGRGNDAYGTFANQALAQATLLFTVVTRLTEMPQDPDLALLAKYAILQMADRVYLEQPNAATAASPYQSETIGSYTYSKGSVVAKAKEGVDTGLFWWDLALDQLTVASEATTGSGSIDVGLTHVVQTADGNLVVLTPADYTYAPAVGYDINPSTISG